MRRFVLTLALAALTTGLAACGGAATPTPSTSTGGAAPSTAATASTGAPSGGTASGGTAACAAAAAGSTATVKITIKDFKYSPAPATAKVGDVVAWTNSDSAPHSATMDDGSCDTDSISSGATAMLTFTKAGTYTYHCKIHPAQMKDVTIQVQ